MTNKFVVPPYEPTAKRTAKDTVFCRIFPLPKYRLALYRTLHPEDKTIMPRIFALCRLKISY